MKILLSKHLMYVYVSPNKFFFTIQLQAKNVARIFSPYFKNAKLKYKTELTTYMSTAYSLFWKPHLLIMHEICKPYL